MSEDVPRSRPPRPKVQLNIGVDPTLKARVTLYATRRGCFESTVVREALEAFLDANEKSRGRP
jgi:hypothetical protein